MRRLVVLLAACLALAGCSSGSSEPKETVTATVTSSPSLSTTEAQAACVDAWSALIEQDPDAEDAPSECEGLAGQADMYMEAIQARNEANREELDVCLEDPACTSLPIP